MNLCRVLIHFVAWGLSVATAQVPPASDASVESAPVEDAPTAAVPGLPVAEPPVATAASTEAAEGPAGDAPSRPTFISSVLATPPEQFWEVRPSLSTLGYPLVPLGWAFVWGLDLRIAHAFHPNLGLGVALDVDFALTQQLTDRWMGRTELILEPRARHAEVSLDLGVFRLTAYPLRVDRLRVGADPFIAFGGQLYDGSWGGRADLELDALRVWIALQSGWTVHAPSNIQTQRFGGLGGVSWSPHPRISGDVSAGHWGLGRVADLGPDAVETLDANALSGRLRFVHGDGATPIFDLWRSRANNDARDQALALTPPIDGGGFGASVELEGVFIDAAAARPDHTGLTRTRALAANFRATVESGDVRAQLTATTAAPQVRAHDRVADGLTGYENAQEEAVELFFSLAAESCVTSPAILCGGGFLRVARSAGFLLHAGPGSGTWQHYARFGGGWDTVAGPRPAFTPSVTAYGYWELTPTLRVTLQATYAYDRNQLTLPRDHLLDADVAFIATL